MKVIPTAISDVVLLEPKIFGDERGFFLESYSDRAFQELGLPTRFVQDNHSKSVRNVLRGIHYQLGTPQGKLVRVLQGEIFDIAVDLRKSSPTFGKWVGEILDDKQRRMLWIPPGFGHGFLVLSDTAEVAYKASEFYAPANERSLLWNDPAIGIEWPLHLIGAGGPVLSAKDAVGLLLKDAEVYA
ncbi:dTDP-4-dehydrorhamnose 3,5-epimerase [Terriglobus roseus DSM 18391]|uniref:dTDP-4-dehydrorhamnose 3,5-epimerase n=1 Tax=Terriglobus roseus (strain DSM 18391 / NRRL B-41598 / KBS 63) TaxID=926566 RepID=I3ZDP7_TERRK|nr:dTDP-4-dehydrorhamnose 3,5-epimerase [Terriglobus roseus]AFL87365.1 dTDP-4-dehydrorhamnose 3,5-epimerase [Terriglobus roseus DSM 18391]